MGINLHREPELKEPVLIACWSGIGNIGLIAGDTLRRMVEAEEFGEIEPQDFFYPKKVLIINGEIVDLEFPGNKFYFKRMEKRDLIFFIGEEQPTLGEKVYAEGTKAYQMANLVLDVAEKFGCKRIYTSGAAVAPIHHTLMSRVWAVSNKINLIPEIKNYKNIVLMSDIERREGQGNISGLNGLLLGVAQKRDIEAICVMGEIPAYLQGFPIVYPKASKAVLEVLTAALEITIDMSEITEFAERSDSKIDSLYQKLPIEAREQLDRLKYVTFTSASEPQAITEDDKKKILEDVDKFFKEKAGENEN